MITDSKQMLKVEVLRYRRNAVSAKEKEILALSAWQLAKSVRERQERLQADAERQFRRLFGVDEYISELDP